MFLGALHVRTEDGWSLTGPLSQPHETQQLRTGTTSGDGLGRRLAARVCGQPRVCEIKWKRLKHSATAESVALLLVGWS